MWQQQQLLIIADHGISEFNNYYLVYFLKTKITYASHKKTKQTCGCVQNGRHDHHGRVLRDHRGCGPHDFRDHGPHDHQNHPEQGLNPWAT